MSENGSMKPCRDPEFRTLLQALAVRFAQMRSAKQESMEKVARACGITRGTVFKTEHPGDHEDLSLATIWSIARHFGYSLSALFQELEDMAGVTQGQVSQRSATNSVGPFPLENADALAMSIVGEAAILQFRADLAEAACLSASSKEQIEQLSRHSAKLRLKRYQLLMQRHRAH